jgi:hypothetical protein
MSWKSNSENFAKEISRMQHKFCQGDFSLTFSFLWHIAWVMYADGKPMNIFERCNSTVLGREDWEIFVSAPTCEAGDHSVAFLPNG